MRVVLPAGRYDVTIVPSRAFAGLSVFLTRCSAGLQAYGDRADTQRFPKQAERPALRRTVGVSPWRIMRMKMKTLGAMIMFATTAVSLERPVLAASCESLATLALPQTTITLAESIARGSFTPPAADGRRRRPTAPLANLPAFCRVAATLSRRPTPTSGSKCGCPRRRLERQAAVGRQRRLGRRHRLSRARRRRSRAATRRRRPTRATPATARDFAPGHPEKLIDFGYRAVHEMTVAAKAIVAAFYGNGPSSRTGTAVRPADARG